MLEIHTARMVEMVASNFGPTHQHSSGQFLGTVQVLKTDQESMLVGDLDAVLS